MHTTSVFGHTETILACRCMQGFVCSYTKRINVVLRILNLTVPIDQNNNVNLNDYVAAIANAAGVPIANVNVLGIEFITPQPAFLPSTPVGNFSGNSSSSSRRIMQAEEQEKNGQPYHLVSLSIAGVTSLDPLAVQQSATRTGVTLELVSFEHKHALRVFRQEEEEQKQQQQQEFIR